MLLDKSGINGYKKVIVEIQHCRNSSYWAVFYIQQWENVFFKATAWELLAFMCDCRLHLIAPPPPTPTLVLTLRQLINPKVQLLSAISCHIDMKLHV